MTYIIAGQLNSVKFLMSDCIASDGPKRIFAQKLVALKSSANTYFALTGKSIIGQCAEGLDYYYNNKGVTNDFCTGSRSINDLTNFISEFTKTSEHPDTEYKENRLYFISPQAICYYDFFYNNNNELIRQPVRQSVPDGFFVDSSIMEQLKPIHNIHSTQSDIESYCKQHIKLLSLNHGNIDLKDRYSFVMFDASNKMILDGPFKHLSDVTAWFNRVPYDSIDDIDFVFDTQP